MRRAAVIGGGLSGLTAAYRFQRAGWHATLFESSDKIGGRVQTVERDGFLIDIGASAIADSYTAYIDLVAELGLLGELVPANPRVAVVRAGRLHELNLQRRVSIAFTRLLSWRAKLRLVRIVWDVSRARRRGELDYNDMARSAPVDNESAADYAKRVVGEEAADYFASPIVRLMLIAEAEDISKVELLSGVANIMNARIYTLRGGQGRLPAALAGLIAPRLNHPVEGVEERADAVEITYRDERKVPHLEKFDACVVCCPLPDASKICVGQQSLLEPLCAGLGYTQCITVALAFARPPATTAFLVQMPAREDAEIALLFLDHNKSSDRVPMGRGLVDCHWAANASARAMNSPDDDIVARSLETVWRLFPELRDELLFSQVTRWRHALPLTAVGAYRLIRDFNARLDAASRVQFASDYMSGAGQNSAVALGNRAVQTLLRRDGG